MWTLGERSLVCSQSLFVCSDFICIFVGIICREICLFVCLLSYHLYFFVSFFKIFVCLLSYRSYFYVSFIMIFVCLFVLLSCIIAIILISFDQVLLAPP